MIDWSRYKLNEVLKLEMKNYFETNKELLLRTIMKTEKAQIWKFQKSLRKAEFYKHKKSLVSKLKFALELRKKNRLGNQLGFSIHCDCFDIGLHIFHIGNITVNGYASIGKFCVLHGNNCIGNSHNSNEEVPVIGDYVEFGWGAGCYGKIKITSNVMLGSHCVVVKDILDKNSIWVGNPQREV